MKILTIGNFTTGWDGSICDEEHIARALEGYGHEVTRWQRGEVGKFDAPYDFALVAQWDGYGPKLREMLRAMTDRIVYWAFDYQADGQQWHEDLIHMADLYLSKRLADSKYITWQWFSQDFAPDFLDKYPGDVEQDIDILFTGSWLPWAEERNNTLLAIQKYAIENKLNFQINSFNMAEWPQTFQNVQPAMMDDSLPYLYARAKVNISIDHTIEAGYWSDRNAQIMASGGFVLFRYVPLSQSIFHDNIEYFHDVEQCLNKIQVYLDHPSVRQVTAQTGYDFAQNFMKVESRVKELLTVVEDIL